MKEVIQLATFFIVGIGLALAVITRTPDAAEATVVPSSSPAQATNKTAAGCAGKIVIVKDYKGGNIEVCETIAVQVQAILDLAKAQGVSLGGWGYRDGNRQIQLRIQNCGGDNNYSINIKPSSSCRPPTARPGRSNHERGLAVDFTCGGNTPKSRSSACFQFLNNNKSVHGLKNLPSEPWHWSINGK